MKSMEKGFGISRNEGKTAIVTGGGQGIGRAICLRLAEEGCDVVVNDIAVERAQKVAEEVEALGRKALVNGADVTKGKEVRQMAADALKQFGKIDILVNNVGGPLDPKKPTEFRTSEVEDWETVMAKNLKSAMLCSSAVINHMVERHTGKIVNLSSGAGVRGMYGSAEYTAAKFALYGFTLGVSHEVVNDGVRINCVAVAPTQGDGEEDLTDPAVRAILERDLHRCNYPRRGRPEEVAALVAFLASEEADFINGQLYRMGGSSE